MAVIDTALAHLSSTIIQQARDSRSAGIFIRAAGIIASLGQGISGLLGVARAIVGETIGALVRTLVRVTEYIYNFDWNATDSSIREQQQGIFESLVGQFGETLGRTVGGIIGGVVPGLIVVKYNPVLLAKYVELAGEVTQEIVDSIDDLVATSIEGAAEALFLELYAGGRRLIKKGLAPLLGGKAQKVLESWGAEGSESWSMASAVEDAIDSIPNDLLKELVGNAYEGLLESTGEAVVIMSELGD